MALWNAEELLRTAATVLAWASLIALGIAWDAHGKFRSLLNNAHADEWDMPPVWERRSRRWWSIGQVTFGVSILFSVAPTTMGAVP